MKKHTSWWSIGYGIALVLFTLYVLLDTFVIVRVYSSETPEEPRQDPLSTQNDEALITDETYMDPNISIILTEYRVHETTVYVADVQISSAEYLRTALAQNAYGRNITEKTSEMAERNGAILAINGDYYGSRERGYVLRNGTLYCSIASQDTESLAIMTDGSFRIAVEGETSAEELQANGAQQILSFGPALLVDGEIAVGKNDEVGKAMVSNPRTAIAWMGGLHYLLVVSDGRTSDSKGLTLYELAEFLQAKGAQVAYNLDGGGSSTMYFNGQVVNQPTTNGRDIRERSVSDVVYIGY